MNHFLSIPPNLPLPVLAVSVYAIFVGFVCSKSFACYIVPDSGINSCTPVVCI